MNTIVRVLFGSNLYGTATPESDTDYKSVHIPNGRDIILQQVKGVIATNSKADTTRKNEAEDIDDESFSLHKYLHLVSQGDMMATELRDLIAQHDKPEALFASRVIVEAARQVVAGKLNRIANGEG